MLVYHDFGGDIVSQIGTDAREKSKQARERTSETRPAAALKCGLGLRWVQESVTLSTSASTKRWYVPGRVLSSDAHSWLHCAWRVGWHSTVTA